MEIREIGEWKVIDTILNLINKSEDVLLPYGDDAISLKIPKNLKLVINVDMLVGETDILPGMTYEQIGKKVVVMCVSDIVAKGAKPLGFLTSIGLRRDMKLKDVEEIYKGINHTIRSYGAYILGGDTNETNDLIIDGVAIGVAKNVISRCNAKEGEIVAVTGLFGNTAAGFKILLNGLDAPKNIKEKILIDVYEPKAYVKEGCILADNNLVSASIDSSDGLALSLHEIAGRSNVGIEINSLPITSEAATLAEEAGLDPFELVFYGGEEYILVVTIKKEKLNEAINKIEKIGGKLIIIGKTTRDYGKIVYREGRKERIIEKKGWQHFV